MASHATTRRGALRLLAGASTAALLPAPLLAAAVAPAYKNSRAPTAVRVADLLARMTLEEKVAQLVAVWEKKDLLLADGTFDFDPTKASRAYPAGIGQITRPSDRRGGPQAEAHALADPRARWRGTADTVAFVNACQKWAVERTRLGIPILFHEEALHGYMAPDATMFPQAIALAGTFDPDLVREVQSIVGREVRAHGSVLALSPVVDIARDPRWGRIEETFGEDPHLCAEMGVAAVTGLQGTSRTLAPGKVFATLKHMTGHGQPEGGNNIGPAPIAERELRENFFVPFRAVVARTAVGAVMPSYNEIDGIPSHMNRWLLGTVLRGEWKFSGAIVSDYGAIEDLVGVHHVAADLAAAARLALAAGVDCNLPDGYAYRTLLDQVRAGAVQMAAIDRACARMLALKFDAGLFEQPYADAAAAEALTGNAEGRAVALKAARRSVCLLTNNGALPLNARKLKKLAVIGPNADAVRLGGYSSVPRRAVSLLDGLTAKLGAARIVFAPGVKITEKTDWWDDSVTLADPVANRQMIKQAVSAARGCDAIVVAIGDTEQTSREGFSTTHLGDRTSLDLVGEQNELVTALKALGKPLIICAINGRPPSWPDAVAQADAVLECWYTGQEAGSAIAEALLGEVNPGAKLPVSVARHVGQLPVFYNRKPSVGRGYLFDTTAPLFPFGHGLSYTTFRLSPPRLSATRIGTTGGVEVSVEVTNTGTRAGDEVVQVYVHDLVASVTRPTKELKAFQRVTLAPGETRTVGLPLANDAFRLWNGDMREVVEPGDFAILTGANSVDLQSATLTVA